MCAAQVTLPADQRVAIIAGGGKMPVTLAGLCSNPLIIGLEGQCAAEDYSDFDFQSVKLGAVGHLFKILKQNSIQHICLIGSLNRPHISDLSLDLTATKLAAKYGFAKVLSSKGDNGLLSLIRQMLEGEGFSVIGAHKLAPEIVAPIGASGKYKPSKQARIDIERGISVVKMLGQLDIGQSGIIQDGVVLGVEAAEGTDRLIARCAELKKGKMDKPAGVLVKLIKPAQDPDLDMPTIGLKTLQNLYESGFEGVAVSSGLTLMADKQEMVDFANAHKMFIWGVDEPLIEGT